MDYSIEDIGCCGAFCGTCKVRVQELCVGCKTGYTNNERDINKAKCKIKKCCVLRKIQTCADCIELNDCQILIVFHSKNGYKYEKYKEAIYYIKENGYSGFLNISSTWKNQYGKYQKKEV